MGCYTAPVAAAIIHFIFRKRSKRLGADTHHKWLNLMFLGAGVFGFVDHLWNGELLSFSVADFMLGLFITLAIVIVWAGVVAADRMSVKAKHECR
ncbi:hypothetical protein KY363_05820 [Candidatus Woesearchaeota archaeon]|nr:hypothetical protein [Candidatus Woesearchaeota archaeon]